MSIVSTKKVAIYGYCEIVYQPDRPFRSGAKVWIETFAPIRADIAEPLSNILSSAPAGSVAIAN